MFGHKSKQSRRLISCIRVKRLIRVVFGVRYYYSSHAYLLLHYFVLLCYPVIRKGFSFCNLQICNFWLHLMLNLPDSLRSKLMLVFFYVTATNGNLCLEFSRNILLIWVKNVSILKESFAPS